MRTRIPRRAWRLTYTGFDPEEEGLREALCALGNGYFVTRAAAPEASADEVHYPGTYLAGCYNRLTTEVQGRPVENEDLVNVPNWLPLTFRIEDGEWFHLSKVKVRRHRLDLDMRSGVLTRFVAFRDDAGRQTEVTQRRLVHMGDKNVAALETAIVARNWSGRIMLLSALDGTVTNAGVPRYRELDGRHLVPVSTARQADDSICLVVETSQSHVRIAEAARVRLHSQGSPRDLHAELEEQPGYVALHIPYDLEQEVPLTIEKTVALFSSRERGISEPGYAARRKLERTPGFEELLETQSIAWSNLWRRCTISLNDHGELNRTLHLHVFHALQTVSPNSVDIDAGVGARGLHGEAYRGHVFWDEAYIFPFFNRTFPELTRELLMYRYRRLPEARRLAHEAGFAGALFPWQSGSDGREETQVIHLNPQSGRWLPDVSHLQRHVNAAIAYSVWQYWESARDVEFLCAHGAEMLLEIARFFASLTTYNEALDRYEIHGVMGPDEYQTGYPWAEEPGLDNNAYTNLMAVWVLSRALDMLRLMPAPRRDELVATLHLTQAELAAWERIRRRMRVVFHDGVISQFEHYDRLEEFDWERLHGALRRHPAPRPDPREGGRHAQPLQGGEAGGRADALLPPLHGRADGAVRGARLLTRRGDRGAHHPLLRRAHLARLDAQWRRARLESETHRGATSHGASSSTPCTPTCSTCRAAPRVRASISGRWPGRWTWSSAPTSVSRSARTSSGSPRTCRRRSRRCATRCSSAGTGSTSRWTATGSRSAIGARRPGPSPSVSAARRNCSSPARRR